MRSRGFQCWPARIDVEAIKEAVSLVGTGCLQMTADDFRQAALRLPGAEESAHMGAADFRVGGHIFATLAAERQGYGNLMLLPEQQAALVEEQPEMFLPVAGGWGRSGVTHIRLANADEEVLRGALLAAWKLRLEKNKKKRGKP